ncbi:MAG: 50S ribosomal protein L21e [Candidatus Nanoarchaeia archaeon]|jgi:large subunit ribosomal protein L21e
MANSHGPRRGTRRKLKKSVRDKGKVTIRRLVQEFKKGERVIIKPEPSIQKGLPYKRFFGKQGFILDKKGKAYIVQVKDGNSIKQAISLPVHLRVSK